MRDQRRKFLEIKAQERYMREHAREERRSTLTITEKEASSPRLPAEPKKKDGKK